MPNTYEATGVKGMWSLLPPAMSGGGWGAGASTRDPLNPMRLVRAASYDTE
mgnify:CR=1 FL=1